MEENDKSSLLGKVRQVGKRLMEVGGEVSRLKTEASQAVDDGVVAARRLAKRSRYAAEDLIDDAAHRVKRHSATLSGHWLGDRPRFGRTGRMAGDTQGQGVARKSALLF
jgi:hypothetical protein